MFVSKLCVWEPPADDLAASPKLEWTEAIFRRRLSQLTKMTVQVVHDIFSDGTLDKNTKLVFVSFRGELEREFKVNKTLIQEESILPAAFSLSVFNAAIAQATIALGLKGGYTCVFPSGADFASGVLSAAAPVLAQGGDAKTVLVYADENVPDYYKEFLKGPNEPLAFAALLSSQKTDNSVELNLEKIPRSPREFVQAFKR
ncbi:MAG: beta-ketoacyl synthase chain length factor [Treponema sp.]|nr:beta-ketoacyl synthase chain length factor [Treponema sp.]MEE3435401.1 beta-ketoacyl synthase chain length factor [Treponema sp.]